MRKILKIVGLVVLTALIAAAAAVGVLLHRANTQLSVIREIPVAEFELSADPAVLAEGGRLFQARGCAECHGGNASGRIFIEDPVFGTYQGANLTTGANGLPAGYKNSDFERAIRHAVGSRGQSLILMPSRDYNGLAAEEVVAIVSYLRSLPAVDTPPSALDMKPFARILYAAGKAQLVEADFIDHAAKPPQAPPVGETVAYGEYLSYGCRGCHGTGLSGGHIPGTPPTYPDPLNLTPHATGITGWTEADFFTLIREGRRKNGQMLAKEMPVAQFSQMTDTEIRALWMFLQTLPPREFGGR